MDFMTSTGFDLVAFQAAMTQAAAKMAQASAQAAAKAGLKNTIKFNSI